MKVLNQLQGYLFKYDNISNSEKNTLLNSFIIKDLKSPDEVIAFSNYLLFILAHPNNKLQFEIGLNTANKLCNYLKQNKKLQITLQDTGLPFTTSITQYSIDATEYLLQQKHCTVRLDSQTENSKPISNILKHTLSSLENFWISDDMSLEEFCKTLHIPSKDILANSIQLLQHTFVNNATIKDELWNQLSFFIQIQSIKKKYSILFNRLSFAKTFCHIELLKKIDLKAIVALPLPKAKQLNALQKYDLIQVIKHSMLLSFRETDTATYMEAESLRYFDLERGVSIALYGMQANRQIALESYIGYTLFKNGYPMAYGGAWIWGETAKFGLNIFEYFRGAESAFIMAQLLRVYKHSFCLKLFEVDAYQFGKDNIDGIASGAFWFYYKFGFRPIATKQRRIATEEIKKMHKNKTYKSSSKILEELAESNAILAYKKIKQVKIAAISQQVSKYIQKQFNGNRIIALNTAIKNLELHISARLLNKVDTPAKQDWALVCAAYKIDIKKNAETILQLLDTKTKNPYKYNELLLTFLSANNFTFL